jgi:hypothetical protein
MPTDIMSKSLLERAGLDRRGEANSRRRHDVLDNDTKLSERKKDF